MSYTLDGFQKEALKSALPRAKSITYMSLGLCNESGEVAGKLKKMLRGDTTLAEAREQIADELGDTLWYCAGLAHQLGFDLSEIAQRNIDKLHSRQLRGVIKGSGDER